MTPAPRASARQPSDGLLRVIRGLATASDPQAAVSDILREAMAAAGAVAGGIYVPDRAHGLVALATSSPQLARDPGQLPMRVASLRQPVAFNRRDQLASLVPARAPYGAAVGVPVLVGGGGVGALVLYGEHGLSASAGAAATVYGDLLAVTLRIGRVERDANIHQKGLGTLAEVGRRFTGVLDVEDLLGRVLDGAESLLGAIGGFVCLFEEDTGTLQLGLFRWVSRDAVRGVMAHEGFRDLLRENSPRLVRNVSEDAIFAPLALAANEPVSLVSVPLRTERTSTGLLVAMVPDHHGIEGEHLSLAASFGDQAALAILGAELHATVNRKEAEMSAVVSSIDNPVVVIDPASRFMVINPAAESLFALTSDFDRGTPVTGRITPAELEEFLLTGWGVREFDLSWPVPRTYRASVHELRNREHVVIGRVMVLMDLTRERELEQMKGDFVSVIGHELRTPITVIKGFVKTLLKKGDKMEAPQREKVLETMASQTQRLERLIEDLLFVSQVETSRPPLLLEEDEVVSVCRRVVTGLKEEWPDRIFHLETTHDLVPMVVDVAKLEQILRHLVENALKYSSDDVWLQIFMEEEEVQFDVLDTGSGIYSGDLGRLFQRFGQIDSGLTRAQGGTGMGLYICRRLTEVQGGRIWVESQKGKGSTFHVAIPRGLEVGATMVALPQEPAAPPLQDPIDSFLQTDAFFTL